MIAHVYNRSTWELQRRSEVQSHPQLHSELKASLGYISEEEERRVRWRGEKRNKGSKTFIESHLVLKPPILGETKCSQSQ